MSICVQLYAFGGYVAETRLLLSAEHDRRKASLSLSQEHTHLQCKVSLVPRNRSTLVWSQVFKFLCSFKRRKSEKGTKPTQAERHTTAERRGSADRHFTRTNTTRTTVDLRGVGTAAFEVICTGYISTRITRDLSVHTVDGTR